MKTPVEDGKNGGPGLGNLVRSTVLDVRSSFSHKGNEEPKTTDFWKYLEVFIAEFVGTGLLMCLGCMGGISGFTNFVLPPLQGPVNFGMVVACLIQIFGHISAAHFNPAVTACFFVLGGLSISMCAVYLVAEILGAIAGLFLLKILTPNSLLGNNCLCCTVPHPDVNEFQALAIEFLATSFLILMVCSVSDPVNSNKQDSAPLKFGFLIIAISIAAGPYTGASMNPARSFAPAVINGTWVMHWVYWIGPLLAGFIVPLFYKFIFMRRSIR